MLQNKKRQNSNKYSVIVWSHKKVCISHLFLFQVFLHTAWWWSRRTTTCNLHEKYTFLLCSIWLFITLNTLPLVVAIDERHTVWCKSIGISRFFAAVCSELNLLFSFQNSVMPGTTECPKTSNTFINFPQKWLFWEYCGSGREFWMIDMEKLCIPYVIHCGGDFLAVEEMKDNCLNVTHMGARLEVSLYWYQPLRLCHYSCLVF